MHLSYYVIIWYWLHVRNIFFWVFLSIWWSTVHAIVFTSIKEQVKLYQSKSLYQAQRCFLHELHYFTKPMHQTYNIKCNTLASWCILTNSQLVDKNRFPISTFSANQYILWSQASLNTNFLQERNWCLWYTFHHIKLQCSKNWNTYKA